MTHTHNSAHIHTQYTHIYNTTHAYTHTTHTYTHSTTHTYTNTHIYTHKHNTYTHTHRVWVFFFCFFGFFEIYLYHFPLFLLGFCCCLIDFHGSSYNLDPSPLTMCHYHSVSRMLFILLILLLTRILFFLCQFK